MNKLPARRYGDSPGRICLVHGGPGAIGELAPVCRELASDYGVLEPRLTAASLEGQLLELLETLEGEASPLVLAGHSFGAMLCLIAAALYPECAARLVLISSGPIEDSYAQGIMATRLARLDPASRAEAREIMAGLSVPDIPGSPEAPGKNALMARLGSILATADAYAPLPDTPDAEDAGTECRYALLEKVWPEMRAIRASGRLLELASTLRLPVTAIHGDYDPHPAEGVRAPLARVLPDFRFIPLPQCGHQPWRERFARTAFFLALRQEIAEAPNAAP